MYARVEECVRFLEMDDEASRKSEEAWGESRGLRPLILCEYSHAMGNSNGNLHKYWELFRSNPRCQGGFVWDWVDQGLKAVLPAPTGAGAGADAALANGSRAASESDAAGGGVRRTWGYGGDFGPPGEDANFCINGVVWPDRECHPAMEEVGRRDFDLWPE